MGWINLSNKTTTEQQAFPVHTMVLPS